MAKTTPHHATSGHNHATHAHNAEHAHNHAHNHTDHAHEHTNHGTLHGYLMGFFLSVNLTIIPFWLVMGHPLEGVFASNTPVALLLLAFAVVQMVVHMVYFLHMHPKSEGGWTFLALFFTIILVIIVMSGSMWVMFHLNTNMMPSHDMDQNMNQMDTTGESWLPSAPSLPPAPGTQETSLSTPTSATTPETVSSSAATTTP